MSKIQPDAVVSRKINDVEDLCVDKCIPNITVKHSKDQEVCMENCLKKVLSALDFLSRFEKNAGAEHN